MYTLFYCNNRFFIKCFRGFESTAENDNESDSSHEVCWEGRWASLKIMCECKLLQFIWISQTRCKDGFYKKSLYSEASDAYTVDSDDSMMMISLCTFIFA